MKILAGKTLKKAPQKRNQIMRTRITRDAYPTRTWKTDPDFSYPKAVLMVWTWFPRMVSPQSVLKTGRWTQLRKPQWTEWEQTAKQMRILRLLLQTWPTSGKNKNHKWRGVETEDENNLLRLQWNSADNGGPTNIGDANKLSQQHSLGIATKCKGFRFHLPSLSLFLAWVGWLVCISRWICKLWDPRARLLCVHKCRGVPCRA